MRVFISKHLVIFKSCFRVIRCCQGMGQKTLFRLNCLSGQNNI
jgi:hypothetical protein